MEHVDSNKTSVFHVVLATLLPFIVGLYAARVTLQIGEQYGRGTMPVVLAGWCFVMVASAGWLNWAVFRSTRTFRPFIAATTVILLVWLWQKLAFEVLIPQSGLTYGYFKTPAGAKAGVWVLTCPFWVGVAALSVCLITEIIIGWRTGRRALLMCVIPWWLAAFLIFSLPSMYLDAQGNASIFI